MIFAGGAALDEHAPGRVEHQHRDGAMAQVKPMGVELAGRADRQVVGVDQNDLFLAHAQKSFF
jgi:hypothetical protein